jgi:acyl-CoA synthetase (AMP-forming)/AMP-acid ligase II
MDKPQKEPLATWAAVQPERTALSDRFGILSYRELDGLVRRIACGLWGLGVRPGDVVAIQLPNRREFVLFQQAAARIGAAYLPLIMSLRAGDLKHILEACDARVMVVPSSYRGFDHAGMIADCRAYLPGLKHVFVVDAAGEDPANISLDLFLDKAWEDEFEGAVENLEIHPDSLRHILFTSGTESLPKGVLHSHNTTFFPLRRHRSYFGLGPEEAVFVATPVGHASGSLFGSELALFLGGKMVLQETWDREQALRLIAQEKCTIMWGATTFFVDLVNTELPAGLDLSAFRLACSAGAPIPRSLVDLVRQHLGARLISAYGSSEGHNVSIAMLDDPLSRVAGSIRGSTGKPWTASAARFPPALRGNWPSGVPTCVSAIFHRSIRRRPSTRTAISIPGIWWRRTSLDTSASSGAARTS